MEQGPSPRGWPLLCSKSSEYINWLKYGKQQRGCDDLFWWPKLGLLFARPRTLLYIPNMNLVDFPFPFFPIGQCHKSLQVRQF